MCSLLQPTYADIAKRKIEYEIHRIINESGNDGINDYLSIRDENW